MLTETINKGWGLRDYITREYEANKIHDVVGLGRFLDIRLALRNASVVKDEDAAKRCVADLGSITSVLDDCFQSRTLRRLMAGEKS